MKQTKLLTIGVLAASMTFASNSFAETAAYKSLVKSEAKSATKLYNDLDQDGVTDDKDLCVNSAPGSTVDARGCAPAPKLAVKPAAVAPTPPPAKAEPLPEPVLNLQSTFFDLDKSTIKADQIGKLRQSIASLSSVGSDEKILLTGHTCDLGPEAYNMKLSWKRANTIKNFITEEMPELAGRIYIEGKGEANPRYANTSEDNRKKNRRVAIRVLEADQMMPSDATQNLPASMK